MSILNTVVCNSDRPKLCHWPQFGSIRFCFRQVYQAATRDAQTLLPDLLITFTTSPAPLQQPYTPPEGPYTPLKQGQGDAQTATNRPRSQSAGHDPAVTPCLLFIPQLSRQSTQSYTCLPYLGMRFFFLPSADLSAANFCCRRATTAFFRFLQPQRRAQPAHQTTSPANQLPAP